MQSQSILNVHRQFPTQAWEHKNLKTTSVAVSRKNLDLDMPSDFNIRFSVPVNNILVTQGSARLVWTWWAAHVWWRWSSSHHSRWRSSHSHWRGRCSHARRRHASPHARLHHLSGRYTDSSRRAREARCWTGSVRWNTSTSSAAQARTTGGSRQWHTSDAIFSRRRTFDCHGDKTFSTEQNQSKRSLLLAVCCLALWLHTTELVAVAENNIHVFIKCFECTYERSSILQSTTHSIIDVLQHLRAFARHLV